MVGQHLHQAGIAWGGEQVSRGGEALRLGEVDEGLGQQQQQQQQQGVVECRATAPQCVRSSLWVDQQAVAAAPSAVQTQDCMSVCLPTIHHRCSCLALQQGQQLM